MSNAKKFLIIVFTVMLVISLQFNTPLTYNMNQGILLDELIANIFLPEAVASKIDTCNGAEREDCRDNGWAYICWFVWYPQYKCIHEQ